LSKERGRERLCYNHFIPHIHNLKYLHGVRINLRKEITPQEKILWHKLRNSSLGYRFRRQHSIGNFIADFFCAEKRLIIELDGSQHLDNVEHDKERTNYFESLGIKVIRFWNNEVNTNINGVLMKIEEELGQP
jgi:very-short-patch-repair endonuclease